MSEVLFPRLTPRGPRESSRRTCAGHRAWVKRHFCCVRGCRRLPVVCAHVRMQTDGGTGIKPSDRWTISLCDFHHLEQHQIGEQRFGARYSLDLLSLAREFARRSPYRSRLLAD